MKLNKTMVITDNPSQIRELVSAAGIFGEEILLIYAGDKDSAVGADKAYWLGTLEDNSFINCLSAIIEIAVEEKPGLVLLGNTSNCRLAAAQLAVKMDTAVLTDISEMEYDGTAFRTKRLVYGGAAIKTDVCKSQTAVVILNPGTFPIVALDKTGNIAELGAKDESVCFESKQALESGGPNLAIAKRVIAVGRGVPNIELMDDINKLAKSLGCGIGCTRPIAEDNHWLPKNSYIGVSGAMLKPDFYIGFGISGQVQHMVGINTARTIFAVDKDKNAPIFKQCDYGLIADNTVVLPILAEKLKDL